MPRKRTRKSIQKPVIEKFTDIVNISFSGKEVIIFHNNSWKHYWIPSKKKVTVPSNFEPSSQLTEMVRREQIQIIRR